MRALAATVVALTLLLSTGAPHVHVDAAGGDECAVCVLRHAAPPGGETPDVAPVVHVTGDASSAPGLPPVTGAPLGSVPGQSPPARA